jgi:acyl-CoA synthetase (NDP forming)
MFIPDYKLGIPSKPASPLAVITQSGAFAISKVGKLSSLNPKYVVTFGNQMDLTVGDYIEYLKQDTDIATYAVYVEGFKPLDGTRFLDAARDITRTGRTVILYKAGRTAAGARASASHTASVAGDYTVTRELARQAGITVAESIADFEDLVMLFGLLAGKHVAGWRLGAVSNAGFEGVTVADNLARFQLATLSDSTVRSLRSVFERARIDTIVDLRNPLDLTPMTADAEFEDAVSALVADPGVDVGVIGCVPLTPALNTLAAATGHREDVFAADSIARRLVEIYRRSRKAWVAVVDGGPLYDPMAHLLRSEGIPTFRTADRAVRLLEVFCAARLEDGT